MTSQNSSGYKKQGDSSGPRYVLRTFGGSTMPGANNNRWESDGGEGANRPSGHRDDVEDGGGGGSFASMKLGIGGLFTKTIAVGRAHLDNQSDEEILGEEYRQSRFNPSSGREELLGVVFRSRTRWRVIRS